MVKANLKPTTVHCKDRLQGRKRESESATSHPCLRNCPMGFSGARNEKSSSASGSWGKRRAARSRAEPPSMSPLLTWGWSETPPSAHRVWGLVQTVPQPMRSRQPSPTGALQPSPKPWAPQQQLQAIPPPTCCFPNPA